jgi:FlaA1/EpsC-like NDP-sugar epimerase
MLELTDGVDIIYHLAAMKHVDISELNPHESLETNLQGTKNILECQRINNINKVVFVSTDKAVYPINVYGMCKGLSERLVLQDERNAVCRYGNVFGSKGSIFSKLPGILEDTNEIKITNPEMTRFWIKVEDAAKFVAEVGLTGKTGVNIPDMKAANVLYMMRLCAKLLGYPDPKVTTIGLRPGEKLHEDLDEELNSEFCNQFTENELRELLCESLNIRGQGKYGATLSSYSH